MASVEPRQKAVSPGSPGSRAASAGKGRSRRRRRRPKTKPPADPAEVIAAAAGQPAAPIETSLSADIPLTEQERQAMRRQLRFLKEHRKILHLRVNAQEDLLLNGDREPTHRGVCQHLLAKVDRARVVLATQTLEPVAATRLAEGVLRLSPDVDYLLLYLECVKRSASQKEAALALSEGLARIDFSQVTASQMRRVLELVVEIFEPAQRPQALLGLLGGRAFRAAFDEAAATLPEALAALVQPLRAVQEAALQGRVSGTVATDALRQGTSLLLRGEEAVLRGYAPSVRRRLFLLGLQSESASDPGARSRLGLLLDTLGGDPRDHGELGLELVRWLLVARCEREAHRQLQLVVKAHPDLPLAVRWLDAMDAPRWGRLALVGRRSKGRCPGMWLDRMVPVWVYSSTAEAMDRHRAARSLFEELCLTGLPQMVAHGVERARSGEAPALAPGDAIGHEGSEQPEGEGADLEYYAIVRRGLTLEQALGRKGGIELEDALEVCSHAVGLLSALALAGVLVDDCHPRRFDLDGTRLWLTDLFGARRLDPSAAREGNLEQARRLCGGVLRRVRQSIVPGHLQTEIESAPSFPALRHALWIEQRSDSRGAPPH